MELDRSEPGEEGVQNCGTECRLRKKFKTAGFNGNPKHRPKNQGIHKNRSAEGTVFIKQSPKGRASGGILTGAKVEKHVHKEKANRSWAGVRKRKTMKRPKQMVTRTIARGG